MKNKILRTVKNLIFMSTFMYGIQAQAQFATSPIFQSGMVLQRDVDVPIWGTSNAGDVIQITCNDKQASATTDSDGKWKVTFPQQTYGGPYTMVFTVNEEESETYTDVYFGDVFYCSGQSNMELEVLSCNDYSTVKANANDETIRQMKIQKGTSAELSDELPSVAWKPATSTYVGNFSAAAYFFALEMKKLDAYKDIPIGILNVSYGGARVEAWMSKEMLGYDSYDITLAQGEKERQPTLIYNKMVNPIIGIPFKAMLWYQAESNCDIEADAIVYNEQFNNMINSYRSLWNNDFPVIWVQLPNYKSETRSEVDNSESHLQKSDPWITMREQQTKSLSQLSNSAEIIIIDAGLAGNIHPTDKQTVGTRLALAARKLIYNEDIAGYSPMYKSHIKNDDGSVTISFDNVGEGLTLYEYEKTSDSKLEGKTVEGNSVTWFSVVTSSGLKRATAILNENNTVTVSYDGEFTAIRYAWDRCPGGMNLYAKSGDVYLPAAPFYINVETSEFGIVDFSSTLGSDDITAEGGTFVTLTWETGGDVTAYLNDVEVDPNTSAKIMLSETNDYTLKIVDNDDPTKTESKTIHFTVTPAKPTIKLSSKSGLLANPGDIVEIASNAAAPGGFSVTKVDFYVNDELVETVTESPFSLSWTAPETIGDYDLYGIVTNNNEDENYNSTTSEILTITVTNAAKTRFEAEDAYLKDKSGSSIKTDANASNGKYYDLQEFNYMQFNDIIAPEDGDYQVCLAYKAPYGYKEELIYANTTSLGSFSFDETQDWEVIKFTAPFNKGENTLIIKASWTWIQFDYIDILGVTNSTTSIKTVQGVQSKMNAYIDSNANLTVKYETNSNDVSIEIYNAQGKKVESANALNTIGSYMARHQLQPGVYIVKLYCKNEILVQQVVVK